MPISGSEPSEVKEKLHISIDLDQSAHIAITGLVRAINFNKYALSAQYSYEDFHKFKSTNRVPLNFRRKEESEEFYLQDKKEYLNWLSLNGIREMVDSFFMFIDDLLINITLAKAATTPSIDLKELEQIPTNIKDTPMAFSEKIKILEKEHDFNIPHEFKVHLDYFENMRDCISHNLGFVTLKYFPQKAKGGNAARIEWLELNTFSKNIENGKLIKLRGPAKNGIYLKAVKHEKLLPYNKQIQVDFNELEMIAYTTFCIINAYKDEANICINNLLGHGVANSDKATSHETIHE